MYRLMYQKLLTNEIDFVTQRLDKVLPIEVKAEENLRSRSLKAVLAKDSTK